MSLRESLRKQQGLGIGVGAVLIAAAAAAIAAESWSGRPSVHPDVAVFSDDDGQTWFTDSAYQFPPFTRNGKVVSRAYLYTTGKTQFVGFLQRYKPDAKRVLEAANGRVKSGQGSKAQVEALMGSNDLRHGGSEIKLPGTGNSWMPAGQFSTKMVKSPDGQHATAVTP